MFYSIAILSPPYSTLSYTRPDYLPEALCRPGLRVAVPLGRKSMRAGIILDVFEDAGRLPQGVTLKNLLWPLEEAALLDAAYLELVRDLAVRQSLTPGHVFGHILPGGLRSTKVRIRIFGQGRPKIFSLAAASDLPDADKAEIGAALVSGQADIIPPREDQALGEICFLLKDPPWQVRPSAHRQRALLEYLFEHGAVSRKVLSKETGGAEALAPLLAGGLVGIRPADEDEECGRELMPPPPEAFSLSEPQRMAVDSFKLELDKGEAASFLLFGVTGSGKTAVYLELARECLSRGKSVLLLAPEVALALKLRRDAALALPDYPAYFFHGYQGSTMRERTFRSMGCGPCLVIGARSALFLPVPNLGAIVLDEEHDGAFKQDEGFMYQAKEVAWFRMRQQNGVLVLGSATPDIKTFSAARSGRLPLLTLPERVGGRALPEVELVNINGQSAGAGLLAPASLEAVRQTIDRGEQVVVLLNKRGYAPLMYCLECNTVPRCPHCEIGLTYHKGRERLICHYCNYSQPYPGFCHKCNGMKFLPMGEGTEKLAENLAAIAQPEKRVLRLDRDTTRRPGRMEEILQSFAKQEAHILVGTQMLSKGHHFPGVTLALIADGDIGLNLPDYRAAERTFQLLVQASGRAGRGERPGKVIIQTRDTNHYCWKYVINGDFEGFYAEEMARRKARRYPPFVRLALVRISFAADYARGPAELAAAGEKMREQAARFGVTVLGPAPAPLAMLRGRKRFHCLLKGDDWSHIRTIYAAVAETVGNELRFFLDLDPVNML